MQVQVLPPLPFCMAKRKPKSVWRYGVEFPIPKPVGDQKELTDAEIDLQAELWFVRYLGKIQNAKGDWCGKGLPFHVKAAKRILWPHLYEHHWTDMITDTWLEKPGRVGCWGPSSSQKSFTFSADGLVLFYARPQGTTGLISSTTRDALARRIWDYVVTLDKKARERFPWLPGSMIESKQMLLADDSSTDGRSFKNGIIGVPTKKGGQWQGLEEFVGTKNEVIFIIADELHFMPIGILDSLANIASNEDHYFAGMGNFSDVTSPLGKLCEPKGGWESFPDSDVSRVFETRWKHGRAIQLVGMDSPNLKYPEGMEPFKGLIGRRYIEDCAENYGRDSDKFNMFASGKIPKACMSRTVITRAMCHKFNATQQVNWGHQKVVRGYMMDVAYSGVGGDRTPGAPFIFGKDVTGRWRFWAGPIILYRGSDDPKVSHCDAIAMALRAECEAHDIPPEHVFFDGTGRSEFVSACARLWSSKIVPLEFGGRATERPSFTGEKWGDEKPEKKGEVKLCCDVFDRFVTELWWAWRECVTSDQMRGLTEEVIEEGSQRRWELVRGAKYSIEPKDSERKGPNDEPVGMKARGLRSPDVSDMIACGIEGARRLGFPLGKTPEAKVRHGNPWLDHMREKQWDDMKEEELAV